MTTPRDSMTAAINAAIARYDQAIGDGTWRTTARNQAVDQILRGWERTITHAVQAGIAEHQATEQKRRDDHVRPLIHAIRSVNHG